LAGGFFGGCADEVDHGPGFFVQAPHIEVAVKGFEDVLAGVPLAGVEGVADEFGHGAPLPVDQRDCEVCLPGADLVGEPLSECGVSAKECVGCGGVFDVEVIGAVEFPLGVEVGG
jgi:hypothetical protein